MMYNPVVYSLRGVSHDKNKIYLSDRQRAELDAIKPPLCFDKKNGPVYRNV
jgi:hypothetical protein